MSLKITKSHDPITVEQLAVCIYAEPGVGKTTLGFTAEKPLLLDFDNGAHRAAIRKDAVQVGSWSDIASMTAEDLEDYQTIIVDTAGRALDALAADIIASEPKHGRGGALTLQGFGQLKTRFIAWMKLLRSFGKDVVLIAHADEQRNGDDLIVRLDMQGASKNEVYKSADAMGRLYMNGNDRMLNFSPTTAQFGKNPAQLPPLKVPSVGENPNFLGEIIQQVKDKLNALTDEQQSVMNTIAEWNERISQAEDIDAVNALVSEVSEMDERALKVVRGLLHAKATKELGLEPDKEAGVYKVKDEAA